MPRKWRIHQIGFRWDQDVPPLFILHHNTPDLLCNGQLLRSILQLSFADVDLDRLIKLDKATVSIIDTLHGEDQSILIVTENIPHKILRVHDPENLHLLKIL